MTDETPAEIRAYIARFKDYTPEQILKCLGDMRDFLYDNMTPEGRIFFERTRHGGDLEDKI